MLRLGSPVAGQALHREPAVAQEAAANLGVLERSLQAGNVGRRQVEALDQKARRLLDAHLGRLLDVGDMTSASSTASTGSWSMASSSGRTRRSTVLSTSVGSQGIPSVCSSRHASDDLPTRGAPPTR
jgi:hypothetical protein